MEGGRRMETLAQGASPGMCPGSGERAVRLRICVLVSIAGSSNAANHRSFAELVLAF